MFERVEEDGVERGGHRGHEPAEDQRYSRVLWHFLCHIGANRFHLQVCVYNECFRCEGQNAGLVFQGFRSHVLQQQQ